VVFFENNFLWVGLQDDMLVKNVFLEEICYKNNKYLVVMLL